MPKLMSLGEAKVYAKTHFDDARGLESNLPLPPHKKRMSYEESCTYYNKKLFKIWVAQISDEIPPNKRERVLRYLLGERVENKSKKTDKREHAPANNQKKALYLATGGGLSKALRPKKNTQIKIGHRDSRSIYS